MTKQQLSRILNDVPAEFTTGEVMKVLGCARGTVIKYREAGVLPYRDAAPHSDKPDYRYPAEDVLAMRTAYRRDGKEKPRPRMKAAGSSRKFKPYEPKRLKR